MAKAITSVHLIGSMPVGHYGQRDGYPASLAAEHSAARCVSAWTNASNAWNQNWNSSNPVIGLLQNNSNKPTGERFMFIKPVPPIAFLRECFDCNPETGVLIWKARPKSHFATESKWRRHMTVSSGREAGTINAHGYKVVRVTYSGLAQLYPVHRIVWALLHGRDASVIDHINGNRSDNRAENLRELTQSENVRKKHPTKAGLRGAHYDKSRGKWLAQIRIDGRQVFLGRFDTEEAAHCAYLSRLQQLQAKATSRCNTSNSPTLTPSPAFQ